MEQDRRGDTTHDNQTCRGAKVKGLQRSQRFYRVTFIAMVLVTLTFAYGRMDPKMHQIKRHLTLLEFLEAVSLG